VRLSGAAASPFSGGVRGEQEDYLFKARRRA
jgi:hypothetical protein